MKNRAATRWLISLTVTFLVLSQSQSPIRVTPLVLQVIPDLLDILDISARTFEFYARKTLHVLAYGALTLTWISTAVAQFPGWRWAVPTAMAVALIIAIIDESVQATIPHRSGSVCDVLIDAGGIVLGYLTARMIGLTRSNPNAGGLKS
ncbi:MAG: VanZ family protein [Thermaerobacterales bacterium]